MENLTKYIFGWFCLRPHLNRRLSMLRCIQRLRQKLFLFIKNTKTVFNLRVNTLQNYLVVRSLQLYCNVNFYFSKKN